MAGVNKEITDAAEIERILKEAKICRLALMNGEYPYIIPMCFGYRLEGTHLELYFHSAPTGQKIDLIKKNNLAGYELDLYTGVIKDEQRCSVTVTYECITGTGYVEIVNGIEKLTGLGTIINKYDEVKDGHKFNEQALNKIVLIKLTAETLFCRSHQVDEENNEDNPEIPE